MTGALPANPGGTTLGPGDVIAIGTPGGVGHPRGPHVSMKPGDTVEIEAGGTLSTSIEAEI